MTDELSNSERAVALLLQQADDRFLDRLADRIAKRITVESLRPLLREMIILRELELKSIHSDGLARSLLRVIADAGLRLSADGKGGLTAGPPEKVTPYWHDIIDQNKWQLIRELNLQGVPANGKAQSGSDQQRRTGERPVSAAAAPGVSNTARPGTQGKADGSQQPLSPAPQQVLQATRQGKS